VKLGREAPISWLNNKKYEPGGPTTVVQNKKNMGSDVPCLPAHSALSCPSETMGWESQPTFLILQSHHQNAVKLLQYIHFTYRRCSTVKVIKIVIYSLHLKHMSRVPITIYINIRRSTISYDWLTEKSIDLLIL